MRFFNRLLARKDPTRMVNLLFNRSLSWTGLAVFSRSLATLLQSGVSLLKSLEIAGKKPTDRRLGPATRRMVTQLRAGSEVSRVLADEGPLFPDLYIQMVSVAEQTGALPEVLQALADHYENLIRLKRSFVGAITMPILQFVAAIFIVAGLIWLLGMIASATGGGPVDVLQLGLSGTGGALIWLGGWCIVIAGGYFGYQVVARGLRQQAVIHGFLLRIPVVGNCLQSFAVARFAWAFALTQDAGMSIRPSLESSLMATGNGAFQARAPQIVAMIEAGEELSTALKATNLFPADFLEMVHVGETSGTVPELFKRMSPQFEDQAKRALSALTTALGWVIWLMVATLIVFIIFRVFLFYLGMLQDASRGI